MLLSENQFGFIVVTISDNFRYYFEIKVFDTHNYELISIVKINYIFLSPCNGRIFDSDALERAFDTIRKKVMHVVFAELYLLLKALIIIYFLTRRLQIFDKTHRYSFVNYRSY